MCRTKQEYRKQLLNKRNSFSLRKNADSAIYDKLMSECDDFSRIFTYISYGSEVDTVSFITEMIKRGKEIFVPVCHVENCTMDASRIFHISNLKKNKYGILEPNEIIFNNEVFDAIIFPGSAFDIEGNRIGYGKGYYDKYINTLNYKTFKIGVCYDFQLMNKIPAEKHDVKMDMIITENRTICL